VFPRRVNMIAPDVATDGWREKDEIERAATPEFDGRRLERETGEVETPRIDDLALGEVRLMKIDADGMEHKVLAGASATI